MEHRVNKPIFVIGSPRSGTSILAWCLGHHPNIFPLPESNWMGDFAVNIAVAHQIGSARGDLSILSAMDIRDDEFFAAFGRSVNELLVGHRRHLEINRENGNSPSKVNQRWLEATSMAAGPKTRWVDGTPEYSLHICGLRKLFPEARFVHVFRDVDAVVRSMVNFHRATGIRLVATEEEAYRYWLRTVNACLKAEQSYGPRVVYRLHYSALVNEPELAIRSLLDFVGEPYSDKCLDPLAERINSSNVPPDFESNEAAIDPAIVEEARRISAEIEATAQPKTVSPAHAAELEAAFREVSVASYVKVARAEQQLQEQERHYRAAVEQYEAQIASQERHYRAAVEQYEAQIASQESHYRAEGENYEAQIASQERHYTAEVEAYKAQLRELQQEYASVTRKLMRLLNKMEKAAARLRESRRWKLVNFAAVFKAKLSRDKQLPGYGYLDEIVAAYCEWRDVHIQKAAIRQSATPPTPPTQRGNSVTAGDPLANSERTGKPARVDRVAKQAENRCGV